MYDQLINSALQQLCVTDDLSIELEDHLRRMIAIDAECPLDLSSLQDCPIDFPFS